MTSQQKIFSQKNRYQFVPNLRLRYEKNPKNLLSSNFFSLLLKCSFENLPKTFREKVRKRFRLNFEKDYLFFRKETWLLKKSARHVECFFDRTCRKKIAEVQNVWPHFREYLNITNSVEIVFQQNVPTDGYNAVLTTMPKQFRQRFKLVSPYVRKNCKTSVFPKKTIF